MLCNIILPTRLNNIVQLLHFARTSGQVILLSDTDAACVAIALALCLNMLSDADDTCMAFCLSSPI